MPRTMAFLKEHGLLDCAACLEKAAFPLNVPSTLGAAHSGWNAANGIGAAGTLAGGRKLNVTASSANRWALKDGDNSIGGMFPNDRIF